MSERWTIDKEQFLLCQEHEALTKQKEVLGAELKLHSLALRFLVSTQEIDWTLLENSNVILM